METRWTIDNGRHFCQMPDSVIGKQFLQDLRKSRSDLFAYQRITSILQMRPSQIDIGTIYDRDRFN